MWMMMTESVLPDKGLLQGPHLPCEDKPKLLFLCFSSLLLQALHCLPGTDEVCLIQESSLTTGSHCA